LSVPPMQIFGSRRFSISRDIMVTDILQQKSADLVGGLESATYIFTKLDVTPFEMGSASCTQRSGQKNNTSGNICKHTRNIKILARFAAVIILPHICEKLIIIIKDIHTQNTWHL
jgi:hypothetical protein